jgi:acetate kinase
MNIFVVNSGSSSIKYQLFKMPVETPVCSGLVERIGLEHSIITHKLVLNREEKIIKKTVDLSGHEEGLKEVAALLTDAEIGVIKKPGEIDAVGHRVVHGGETFAATTIITKKVKEKIQKLFPLAPLHNPANYLGIEVAEKIFTSKKDCRILYSISPNTTEKGFYLCYSKIFLCRSSHKGIWFSWHES